jgi:hypothetical protein
LERAVLQDVRTYGVMLKVYAPTSGRIAVGTKLAGHFISFFTGGEQAVARYLTSEAVKECFMVQLVGPANTMDTLRKAARSATSMRVDSLRLYNLITMRSALRPPGDDRAPTLPTGADLLRRLQALESLPEELVAEAREVTDARTVAADRLAEADVAGVRQRTDEDDDAGDDAPPHCTHGQAAGPRRGAGAAATADRGDRAAAGASGTRADDERGATEAGEGAAAAGPDPSLVDGCAACVEDLCQRAAEVRRGPLPSRPLPPSPSPLAGRRAAARGVRRPRRVVAVARSARRRAAVVAAPARVRIGGGP